MQAARSYISDQLWGKLRVARQPAAAKIRCQKIQDAHEAIRPTDITLIAGTGKRTALARDQFRLYQLIWKRFTASRMRPAVYETTSVKVAAGEDAFHPVGVQNQI